MKRFITGAFALALLFTALLGAAPPAPTPEDTDSPAIERSSWGSVTTVSSASAHRVVSQQTAEDRVYAKYNSLCGTIAWGWTWCSNRRISLWGTPYGDHSWSVRYVWNEAKLGTLYGCGIIVQYYGHTGSYTVLQGPSCAV